MGDEPGETHEHYDAEGNLTGYTVVTREPEWTDAERSKLLDLAEYEAGVSDCGVHHSIANDPRNHFTLEDAHCVLCANLAREERVRAEQDHAEAERLKDSPRARRRADGRRTYLRELTEAEVEQAKAARSAPLGSK